MILEFFCPFSSPIRNCVFDARNNTHYVFVVFVFAAACTCEIVRRVSKSVTLSSLCVVVAMLYVRAS